MAKPEITGQFENSLNINLFYETLGKVIGDQFGVKLTLVSIVKRDECEGVPVDAVGVLIK